MELAVQKIFLAVAQERSFTRAAAKVHRTQPAVSQAVKRLEQLRQHPPVVRAGRQHKQDVIRAAIPLALPYSSGQPLDIPDARLQFDSDQLRRQPQQQVPGSAIAGIRQQDLRGHARVAQRRAGSSSGRLAR